MNHKRWPSKSIFLSLLTVPDPGTNEACVAPIRQVASCLFDARIGFARQFGEFRVAEGYGRHGLLAGLLMNIGVHVDAGDNPEALCTACLGDSLA